MANFEKPLTDQDRIRILQRQLSSSNIYLSDLEKEHFGVTSYFPREMRDKFSSRVGDPYNGSFQSKYDDYLLDLWDSLENPEAVATGTAQPFGLLLALTQE